MAKRECPFCKEKIHESATLCKHCRSELPPLPPPPEKKWYQTWKGLLLILFIISVLGKAIEDTPQKPKLTPQEEAAKQAEKQRSNDNLDAKTYDKLYIEKALKAHTTAKWQNSMDFYADNAKDKKGQPIKDIWVVSGYVDAQNSFGAMIRTQWQVKLKKIGAESWKLLDIKM